MAFPDSQLGVVGALAARVTNQVLLSFPGFMRWSPARWFSPALIVLGAAASASFLVAQAPIARAECGTASSSPCPSPSPIPTNAFLSLDVTDGGPNTQITVNGGAFLANEQMTLYWDQLNKVAGGGHADGSGNFVTHVKPFTGDSPGVHKLCASVAPNPCANFTLEAATPSPSPSPTPTESPSPSASPAETIAPTISPTPVAATLSSFDVISRPPFVFLPIIGLLAIALSLGYWIVSLVRRPRQIALPSAAVVHRAMRPDYTAGFGTPPPQGPPPTAEPSAWADVPQAGPPSPRPPSAEPPAAAEPEPTAPTWEADANTVAWGTGEPDTGYQFPPPAEESPDTGETPKSDG